MPIDIDELAAEIERRRRRRRELGIGLWCVATEARVLGAMLAEPGVLERCGDVEHDDFADLMHRLIFHALRNVQAGRGYRTSWPGPFDVGSLMAYLEHHEYHAVTWFDVGNLIAGTTDYGAQDTVQLERDVTWLRTLANRRRAA